MPELRDRVRRRLRAHAAPCIRPERSRVDRAEVREVRASLRVPDSVVAQEDLGSGIGQELLRAG
jgi:hypothetical protein